MRLHVTRHAFDRMADWHPIFKPFAPKGLAPLDAQGALAVMNGLHIFVASLERGRPSTVTQRVVAEKARKYRQDTVYIFDRELSDLYQMKPDYLGLSLVTVTWLKGGRKLTILDEPNPLATFEHIEQITVPYELQPDVDVSEYSYLQTPSGRYVEVMFGAP